jgi:cytochrome c556
MRARALRAAALAVLLSALALALGCRQPAQLRYERDVEETPAPARHALHEERLRELMRGLQRLRDERLPQAMDVAGERARRRQELARVARALERSAARLPEVAPVAALDAPAREEFRAHARALEDQARELAADADRLGADETRARLRAIEATCDGCHARFRPGGSAP